MKICVLMAGHLSTSPRLLKAADAFVGAGHQVHVVSSSHVDWAVAADADARRTRQWPWTAVDYTAERGSRLRLWSGVRQRAARVAVKAAGAQRVPYEIAFGAFSRVHDELVRAALSVPVDFYYGGTADGLAATAVAARRARVPYGLDLEDFYRDADESPVNAGLAARIEDRVLPGAACLTAASAAIAAEYEQRCGVHPTVVNNTFPLPDRAPEIGRSGDGRLRLYWFSQTIGPSRGLEEAIVAMGFSEAPALLRLRGREAPGYGATIRALAATKAPRVEIVIDPPMPPDQLVASCHGSDVGLSVEQPVVRNRQLCLTNKAFTYILGGLAVAFTSTPGQRALAADLGDGALVYEPGHPEELARGLRRWFDAPETLLEARRAAWSAARRRWHWEHDLERGALLSAVAGIA